MDRMIYTALNALSVNRDTRISQAQNLANQNVPGFRRDLSNESTTRFVVVVGSLQTRAFQMEAGPAGFSEAQGGLTRTDQELDVAINGEGYFHVLPENGQPALSRRGDMRRDIDGTLRNGAGDAMLNAAGAPIVLPDYNTIVITDIGEIFIEEVGAPPGAAPILAGVLATSSPGPDMPLYKGLDGEIRPNGDGPLPPADQLANIMQGTLESSNVNVVEELLTSIEVQRGFEMGMRMVMTAREMDESGARAMQAPEG
jgi:flagellar basal-body rod protein FlgF